MSENIGYQRSNLRSVLLERALVVLRDRGAGALSLRELARDVGVSHTAPARHFPDRQDLFEALAVEGFASLGEEIVLATTSTSELQAQARRVAQAYVAFAIEKANLVDVMFRHEAGRDRSAIGQSAALAFAPLLELFHGAEYDGLVPVGEAETAATLFLAALQGIAALVNCGVVPPEAVSQLVDNAVPRFIGPASIGPRDAQP